MTKEELKLHLEQGRTMDEAFALRDGQSCTIYKADQFTEGPDIIYIPDLALNEIPEVTPVNRGTKEEVANRIEEILYSCYTGDDFIYESDEDRELAERLFYYCDWQHPSSALPELN